MRTFDDFQFLCKNSKETDRRIDIQTDGQTDEQTGGQTTRNEDCYRWKKYS